MAGISKIVGKTIDDIAKVMSKVLIGLGDAVIGDVKNGKTFYAGSSTLKTGNYVVPTLAEDVIGTAQSTEVGWSAGLIRKKQWDSFAAESEIDLVSLTQTYNDPSITIASAVLCHVQSSPDITFRLYMDGVQVAESADFTIYKPEQLMGSRAMSGVDKICKATIYNAQVWTQFCYIYSEQTSGKVFCFISAGSVKV